MPNPALIVPVINPVALPNTAPSIGGLTVVTNINDTSTATPFSKITITDNDLGAMLTISIRLDVATKGAFTANSLKASGFLSTDGGLTYTHAAGTPAQLQAAIQTLVYQPTANRVAVGSTETTTFTINLSDGIAPTVSNHSTTVVSTSINDVPVAINDTLTTFEDTAVIYAANLLLGNDIDADRNPLTITSITSGSGGTAVLNGDGSVTFTPDINFNGAASFTYIASDGMSTSNSATVTVNVTPVNDLPIANDDTLTAPEDTAITFNVADLLVNDFDAEGPVTIATITNGRIEMIWNYSWDTWETVIRSTGGSAVLNPNGTLTFTPDNDFNGIATFTYTVSDGTSISNSATVSVNVAGVNDLPVVANDVFSSNEDTTVTYSVTDLLWNDTDIDGNLLTIDSITNGIGGTVVLSDDHTTLTFTPNKDFNGAADFTYKVSDGMSISNSGTVTINVAAVNDAPVAINDTLAAAKNTVITYNASDLLANDTDIDGNSLTIDSVINGKGGTVVLSDDHTTLTFTPNKDFNGVADFTYLANDGTDNSNSATVTVNVAAASTINTVNLADFKLGTSINSDDGVDKLDLASTAIAVNTAEVVNGIDAGIIHSHSICNGIISFGDIDSYTTPLTITATSNLANVLDYLQTNITENNTVAFVSEGNTFVFQDGGITDTLVELVGVTASCINTTGLAVGSIWLV